MYHGRFKGTHYDVGYKWGKLLAEHGKRLDFCPTFELTDERKKFTQDCISAYKEFFPEILDEIKGIADGQCIDIKMLQTILFSMYCFSFDNKCTCFAISNNDEIIFARNSDFLVSLEKLYMNCIYNLHGSYKFNANTTAYVQMEDGINEHCLAVGLTFIYPHMRKPGLNAGMLVRYILEKCKTTDEAIKELKRLPMASAQTITLADSQGSIAVVECNPDNVVVIVPENNKDFVVTANNFNSIGMDKYKNPVGLDDWKSVERYKTGYNALNENTDNYSIDFAKDVLAGKLGFMCQYDRKTGADTVWSVVYDLKRKQIWRVEGNPSRKLFKEDKRMKF